MAETRNSAAAAAPKKPVRQCVVCRARKGKEELLRAVLKKSGAVSLDEGGKGQGRGAYVCRDAGCIAKLIKQRGFNRSFKRDLGADIYKEIDGLQKGEREREN